MIVALRRCGALDSGVCTNHAERQLVAISAIRFFPSQPGYGAGGSRRGSMGGEFSATGQFYEEGEEDAPLLARSGEVNAIDVERGLADVDFDYADAPAAAR